VDGDDDGVGDGDLLDGMSSDGYTWRPSPAEGSGRAYLLSYWNGERRNGDQSEMVGGQTRARNKMELVTKKH